MNVPRASWLSPLKFRFPHLISLEVDFFLSSSLMRCHGPEATENKVGQGIHPVTPPSPGLYSFHRTLAFAFIWLCF